MNKSNWCATLYEDKLPSTLLIHHGAFFHPQRQCECSILEVNLIIVFAFVLRIGHPSLLSRLCGLSSFPDLRSFA